MSLLDRLQRWVAIVETTSDKRAETLVAEMRDAIEEMKNSTVETRQKQQFTATDREGYQWQVETRFLGESMYEACLYCLKIDVRHDVDPDWTGYICGTEIDIKAIMTEYLSNAKSVANAFLEGTE